MYRERRGVYMVLVGKPEEESTWKTQSKVGVSYYDGSSGSGMCRHALDGPGSG
jgi:hypothetical protein